MPNNDNSMEIFQDRNFQAGPSTPPTTTEQIRQEINNAVEPAIKKLRKEINDSKKEFIVILGIFASIITFVSVEFQIVKNIDTFGNFIVMTLLLLGSMFIFSIALKSFVVEDVEWKHFRQKPLLFLGIGLILLSVLLYGGIRMYKAAEVRGNLLYIKLI